MHAGEETQGRASLKCVLPAPVFIVFSDYPTPTLTYFGGKPSAEVN